VKSLRVIRSIPELRAWRKALTTGQTVGFVPTMGALHEGHLSLVHASRSECDFTVASIFVNPLQFGPSEDLSKYPRPFDRDREWLEHAGAHVLFAPEAGAIYRSDASTTVVEDFVSGPLCGEFRPGHFRGVATVVLKLFNLVQPDVAYFGQKDAQQCAVIERMVRDLDVPVQIKRGATVREADGLAMSSRNIYLGAQDRTRAPRIYLSLEAAKSAFDAGERSAEALSRIGREFLSGDPAFKIQYWEVRDPSTLAPLVNIDPGSGALLAVAAYLGTTRLIDNLKVG